MIIKRDTNDNWNYDPWGSWGRWVLLAVVIVVVILCILTFFARSRHHPVQSNVHYPLSPMNPRHSADPEAQAQLPKYEPQGEPYNGPVWQASPQQTYGAMPYQPAHAADTKVANYGPPDGPPPGLVSASSSAPNSSSYREMSPPPPFASRPN